MSGDMFQEEIANKNRIERKRRADLVIRYGKKCSTCGNAKRVPDPETGLTKPCPKCRHRRHGSN